MSVDTMAAQDTTRTFVLSPAEFAATVDKAAKVNARAVKRGFTGRVAVEGVEETRTERCELTNRSWTVPVVRVTITGEAPSYGGWLFVAAVDTTRDEDGAPVGAVLRYAPGVEACDGDRAALADAGTCDHCGTRRYRRHTFLVRHVATGATMQVGRSCAKDFTGHHVAPVFVAADDVLDRDDEGGSMIGDGPRPVAVAELLAVAWSVVQAYGWVPRSSFTGTPTADLVCDFLWGTSKGARKVREDVEPHMADAPAAVAKIVTALREGLSGAPGYEANLLAVLGAAWVETSSMGIACSAIGAYDRMVGRQAERAARESSAATTAWAGSAGEKITVTGTVTRAQWVDNGFGSSLLLVVEGDGVVAKTFTASKTVTSLSVGDTVTLTGTVKAHETWQDVPQTVMTRVKAAV